MASKDYKVNLAALTPDDFPLDLIEIFHPNIIDGVYLVRDNKEIVSNGKTYLPVNVAINMHSDTENQLPTITISISNVSRELIYWIKKSRGAKNTRCIFKRIRKMAPDVIEREYPTTLTDLSYNMNTISATLVIHDILNKAAVKWAYTRKRTPNIY